MKFSANLGFLWSELPLPDAIDAAAKAGFDAVECHWPYDTPASEVAAALERNDLPLLCLNTSRGDVGAAENGLSALPGREADARAAIDEALAYAAATKAESIHVMAGYASGEEAEETFLGNLRHACEQAAKQGTTVLIEPLNRYDAPGYFLKTAPQTVKIIERVGAENLQMLFDFYHIQIMEGNLTNCLRDHLGHIGHLQCASVPDRAAPDHGEVDYAHIFAEVRKVGWTKPIGAEYKPLGRTEETLGWLAAIREELGNRP